MVFVVQFVNFVELCFELLVAVESIGSQLFVESKVSLRVEGSFEFVVVVVAGLSIELVEVLFGEAIAEQLLISVLSVEKPLF